jgi:indole-3-glycerol phosphate synthase
MYIKTDTILDKILTNKHQELVAVTPAMRAQMRQSAHAAAPAQDFAAALRAGPHVALIAEIKKASPSKGVLIADFDPVRLGRAYVDNGARAISILIDRAFFQGDVAYLRAVRAAVAVPLLYKEFVIDAYQIDEARAAQADAVLLIAMALEDAHLSDLHAQINAHGMAALVEVHNEAELERALTLGATLIGVNNRDLRTFSEDLQLTERLARLVPPQVTLVSESAIRSATAVQTAGQWGAHAVLVGEGLVTAPDLAAAVRDYSQQLRTGENR